MAMTSTVNAKVSPGVDVDRDGALPGDFESRSSTLDSLPTTGTAGIDAPTGMTLPVGAARKAAPPVRLTRHGAMLRAFRIRAGLSQNELAHVAGCDVGGINKIERYGKYASRPLVLVLVEALRLDDNDRDRLLFAAGHAPVRDFQAILDSVLNRLAAMRQGVAS